MYLRGTLEVIDEIQHHQGTYDGETYWLPQDRIIRLRLQGTQTMLVVWERRRSGDAGPTIKTWVSDPPSAWLRADPSSRLESFALALAVITNLSENFFNKNTNKTRCEWQDVETSLPNTARLVVNDIKSSVVYVGGSEDDLTSSS